MTVANETPRLFQLNISKLVLTVLGTSPLLVNRFAAMENIEDAQSGAAKKKKPPRQPEMEFEASRYLDNVGRDCLPSAAFKESMVRACSFVDGLPMTLGRGAFFVDGDLLPLRASAPFCHRSRVVLNRKTTSIAYRACYEIWECDLSISYQENVISAEQIINILELAGFAVGVGAWRPQCKGQFGRFEIKKT